VRWVRLGLVAGLVVGGGCSGDDDEALVPLPVDLATLVSAPAETTLSVIGAATTAPATTSTSTTTTVAGVPVGDWDGARFDVGTIASVGQLGGYRTISFDRYSYQHPTLGLVDAPALADEPIAAWWRVSPFSNVRVQLRSFVLDPDVEVLVLADDARACDDPATVPAPRWEPAGVAVLGQPESITAIATLTYSPTGQITRIRLTRGC
jgi:hypothetical protein